MQHKNLNPNILLLLMLRHVPVITQFEALPLSSSILRNLKPAWCWWRSLRPKRLPTLWARLECKCCTRSSWWTMWWCLECRRSWRISSECNHNSLEQHLLLSFTKRRYQVIVVYYAYTCVEDYDDDDWDEFEFPTKERATSKFLFFPWWLDMILQHCASARNSSADFELVDSMFLRIVYGRWYMPIRYSFRKEEQEKKRSESWFVLLLSCNQSVGRLKPAYLVGLRGAVWTESNLNNSLLSKCIVQLRKENCSSFCLYWFQKSTQSDLDGGKNYHNGSYLCRRETTTASWGINARIKLKLIQVRSIACKYPSRVIIMIVKTIVTIIMMADENNYIWWLLKPFHSKQTIIIKIDKHHNHFFW